MSKSYFYARTPNGGFVVGPFKSEKLAKRYTRTVSALKTSKKWEVFASSEYPTLAAQEWATKNGVGGSSPPTYSS